MLKLYDLSIEYQKSCSLVPVRGARFGWKLSSDKNDTYQKCFCLSIASEGKEIFSSGVIESSESFHLTFDEMTLPYGAECTMTVAVTDTHGERAEATLDFATEVDPAIWEKAEWIRPAQYIDGASPYLRTKFDAKKVEKAMLYASGLGYAYYYINGENITDALIDPPQSNYRELIYYRSFDVTNYLREGKNALTAQLGQGFYAQNRAWTKYNPRYGQECLIAVLVLTYADGTTETISTNTETWTAKYSPIIINNVYAGEVYDARFETEDYALPEGDEFGWGRVVMDEAPKGELQPTNIPPVRIIREIPAKSIKPSNGIKDGTWVIDIGENMAGIAEFKFPKAPAGTTFVLRYAETVDELGKNDYRSAGTYANQLIQQDIYIAKGTGEVETFRPKFTYHGFRYVEITGINDLTKGYGKIPSHEIVTAYAMSTDFEMTADFRTSHADLQKFWNIIDNTFRSNYHGVPTDCPTRERCGWMGDAQVNCNVGLVNYDTATCYEKYYTDIITSKLHNGFVTNIAPGMRTNYHCYPDYGASLVVIPYYLFKYYGDLTPAKTYLPHLKEWIEECIGRSKDLIIDEGLGDWDPPVPEGSPRRMPPKHSATFTFFEVTRMLSEICRALGDDSAEKYEALAADIKKVILANFYDAEKHTYGYWASNGAALHLGLYPDGEKELLRRSTVQQIADDKYAMCTGLYGNKYLPWALFENDETDTFLKYAFNRNAASYGRIFDLGATTIWEEIDQGAHNSFETYVLSYNHVMHGNFAFAICESLAGMTPTKAGFSEFAFRPSKTEEIKDFKASLETVSGKIEVEYDGKGYTLTVPANTTCTLPDGRKVGSGVYHI
ncbi:MAG: family 78 glycoside hydrolase catalytic domain [Clostridia bacterium]|nr:family 78 glycoside hydrolase catalytic domain [Clostridia bacterium]